MRWLDVVLGYGQLSVVEDLQESKKGSRKTSLRGLADVPESRASLMRTVMLNIKMKLKKAWPKNRTRQAGCVSSSHGILSSGRPIMNMRSMTFHLRNSQTELASSSIRPTHSYSFQATRAT